MNPALGKYYKVNVYDGDKLLTGDMKYSDDKTAWTFTPANALSGGLYTFTAKVSTFDGSVTGAASETRKVAIHVNLTDTGITADQCYPAISNNKLTSCSTPSATGLNNQQDGMVGLDVDSKDDTDGKLGFSYSLVQIPNSNDVNYDKTECVKDNITGLMWEGKPADLASDRDYRKSYTNYVSGSSDADSNKVTAEQLKLITNAQGYVSAVNDAGLCGYKDWRLPTASELQSLVDYSVTTASQAIEKNWFPNTQSDFYWTSSSGFEPSDPKTYAMAWAVQFKGGVILPITRSSSKYVRLVR